MKRAKVGSKNRRHHTKIYRDLCFVYMEYLWKAFH